MTAAAPKPFSYPPPKGVVTPAAVLRGALDERQAIATMPASHTLKGMFFTRLVSDLGEDWSSVASELRAPPSLGRYIPFFGPRYAYAARAERQVELRLFNGHAPWENVIGQLEGVVLHYGGRPEIECRWEAEATRLFTVRWS